jgi:hypothetical protein
MKKESIIKERCCEICDFFIDNKCRTDLSEINEQDKKLIALKYNKSIEIVNKEFICQTFMKVPV